MFKCQLLVLNKICGGSTDLGRTEKRKGRIGQDFILVEIIDLRGLGNDRAEIIRKQVVYIYDFMFLFSGSTVLLLLLVFFQLLPQVTFTVTVHFRFIPVFAQYARDVAEIDFVFQHNHELVEVLQHQPGKNGYEENVFHDVKLIEGDTKYK